MTNVNFKAKYIAPANVLKRAQDENFKKHEVSFVEFYPDDEVDVSAVRKAAFQWKLGDQYGYKIAMDIKKSNYVGEFDIDTPQTRYFGVTRQKADLINPRAYDILGLVEVHKKSNKEQYIRFLQVDPENNMKAEEPLFKGVGSAILRGVQNLFLDNTILLRPVFTTEVINFYQKNGFELIDEACNMMWDGAKKGKSLSRII